MSGALNAGVVDRCTTGSPRSRPLPARLAPSPRSVRRLRLEQPLRLRSRVRTSQAQDMAGHD